MNDLGGALKGDGQSSKAADSVVAEIRASGGQAIPNYDSVDNGERIIQAAIREYGHVHVLINNAGILRDVAFKNMSDTDWDLVIQVHVRGAYKVAKPPRECASDDF